MSIPNEDLVHAPICPYCGNEIKNDLDHDPTCRLYPGNEGTGGGDGGGTTPPEEDTGTTTTRPCGKLEVTIVDCIDCQFFLHNGGECLGHLQQ
jgi:hypothetical protein